MYWLVVWVLLHGTALAQTWGDAVEGSDGQWYRGRVSGYYSTSGVSDSSASRYGYFEVEIETSADGAGGWSSVAGSGSSATFGSNESGITQADTYNGTTYAYGTADAVGWQEGLQSAFAGPANDGDADAAYGWLATESYATGDHSPLSASYSGGVTSGQGSDVVSAYEAASAGSSSGSADSALGLAGVLAAIGGYIAAEVFDVFPAVIALMMGIVGAVLLGFAAFHLARRGLAWLWHVDSDGLGEIVVRGERLVVVKGDGSEADYEFDSDWTAAENAFE